MEVPKSGSDTAPPELVAMAEAAVREFEVRCFWFWRPDVVARTADRFCLFQYPNATIHKRWFVFNRFDFNFVFTFGQCD